MKQEWKAPLTKEKSSPGGFAVEGSGFGVQSLVGSRVYSINYRAYGLGFRVECSEFSRV